MFKHILLPTDGSELSDAALQAGLKFCKEIGAKATVLTITLPFPNSPLGALAGNVQGAYETEMRKTAEARLASAKQMADAAGVRCDTLSDSHWQPYQAIVSAAESAKCDAIFMASHGRRGVVGLLLGSETQKVLTHSKLPVIVYR